MLVYQIRNKLNNKSYIGQTKYDFRYRYWKCGRWWNATGNIHLKRAAKLHGKENFEVVTLIDEVDTEERLNILEEYFIKELNTLYPNGYNFCSGGARRNYTQNICDKIAQVQRGSRLWSFKAPSGEVFEFPNLAKFCKEKGLSRTSMLGVENGRYRQHRGWTLPHVELRCMSFKSPVGETFLIKERELRPFCRHHNLHHGAMIEVHKEHCKQHKGWKKHEITI